MSFSVEHCQRFQTSCLKICLKYLLLYCLDSHRVSHSPLPSVLLESTEQAQLPRYQVQSFQEVYIPLTYLELTVLNFSTSHNLIIFLKVPTLTSVLFFGSGSAQSIQASSRLRRKKGSFCCWGWCFSYLCSAATAEIIPISCVYFPPYLVCKTREP